MKHSNLDRNEFDEICKKIKQAIETKNSIFRNLKYSLAHATKAYDDAIRVYEAKLLKFSIQPKSLVWKL